LKGKSNNTPAFLIASLLEEGIIHRSVSEKRCYELSDVSVFMAKIKPLMESKTVIEKESKPLKKKPVTESLIPE
jgi:predicted transcriptional regulator